MSSSQFSGQVTSSALKERSACSINVDAVKLTAKAVSGEEFSIHLDELHIELGGVDKDFVYFKRLSEGRPENDLIIYLKGRDILAELAQLHNFHINSQLDKMKNQLRKKSAAKLVSVVLLLSLVVGIPAFIFGFGVNIAVRLLPYSIDEKLGEAAYDAAIREMAGSSRSVKSSYVKNNIEKIVQRLADAVKDKKFNYEVKIIHSPVNNAFALPGGKIAVFTGLLKSAENAEEVAGVLAHEIMHVEKRHGTRQMVRTAGTSLLLAAILGDSGALADFILSSAAGLAGLSFSRGMEEEADNGGVELLFRANIRPTGLVSFFRKLQKEQKSKPVKWLSTHPLSEDRVENLTEKIKERNEKIKRKLKIDWKRIVREINGEF